MTSTPKWVLDLVMHLQRHEEEHPTLYQLLHGAQFVEAEWCPAVALAFVPPEVRAAAQAIADYGRQAREEHRQAQQTRARGLLVRLATVPPAEPDQ